MAILFFDSVCRSVGYAGIDVVFLGEVGGEMRRDHLAKLGEDGQLRPSCFVMIQQGDPGWYRQPATRKKITAYGMAVDC
jgi:hypothetical protein